MFAESGEVEAVVQKIPAPEEAECAGAVEVDMTDKLILCRCGHEFYLHDEAEFYCASCDCEFFSPMNPSFRSEKELKKMPVEVEEHAPAAVAAPEFRVEMIAVADIAPSNTNPRKFFNSKKMEELTESIRQHGVQQPLLVRPDPRKPGCYVLVFGERRLRAAIAAKLILVPARVKSLSDKEALELQVIENDQREDVTDLERAEGYHNLISQGYTVKDIAGKINKSESHVYQCLKLLELIPDAKKACHEERMTAGHAVLIARLQPADQKRCLQRLFDDWPKPQPGEPAAVSVRALAKWIANEVNLHLNAAPFKKNDPELVKAAGACTECVKRTGFSPALFPDIKDKDICTDPACYNNKLQAHFTQLTKKLEAEGATVLRISADWQKQEGVLINDQWKEIPKDSCPNGAVGIVVASGYNEKQYNRGQLIHVCANKKCAVHWKDGGSEYQARQKDEAKKLQLGRAIRSRLMAEIVTKAENKLSRAHWNLIAIGVFRRLQHDDQVNLYKRRGWTPVEKTQPYKHKEYDGAAMERRIEAMSDRELQAFVLEVSLSPAASIASFQSNKTDIPAELVAAAKPLRIDPAAIRLEVTREFKNPKKAEKKEQVTAKPATKPKPAAAKSKPGWRGKVKVYQSPASRRMRKEGTRIRREAAAALKSKQQKTKRGAKAAK